MFTTQAWQDLLFPGNAKDFFTRVAMQPFDHNSNGYCPDNARWLMELSRLVYRHDAKENVPILNPTIDSFLMKVNFTKRGFFLDTKTDTQAMLVESTGVAPFAVLVFRGTEQTPKDAFIDANVGRIPLDESKIDVHDGFLNALDSVWGEIEEALDLLPYDCTIFYTGHSLGAALATLAAARTLPTKPLKAVYTFGSPRVGNQKFVDSLNGIPFYRVVDDQDFVTTLPPEEILDERTGFVHVGDVYQLREPPSHSRLFFDPPKPLADHAPVNYVSRI